MKRPRSQRSPTSSFRRIDRFVLKLVGCFMVGLLLSLGLMELNPGLASAQSAVVSPVFRDATAEEQALEKRPLPFNSSTSIPDEVKVCMDSSGECFDLLGTVQDTDKTYYLLNVYQDFVQNNPLNAFDELIETDSATGCTRLTSVDSVSKPLSVYMSEVAAQDLERQRYQHYSAQLGGISQLQETLAEHINAAHGLYLLSAEQIHALQQLGVSFPSNYRLLTADTFSF